MIMEIQYGSHVSQLIFLSIASCQFSFGKFLMLCKALQVCRVRTTLLGGEGYGGRSLSLIFFHKNINFQFFYFI